MAVCRDAHAFACTDATGRANRVVASVQPAEDRMDLLGFQIDEHCDASTHCICHSCRCVSGMNRPLPMIHRIEEIGDSQFRRQQLDLEFSNGERRLYQRHVARGYGAVVVVPLLDPQTVLLVREYAAGIHRYELGLVKGRIDANETPEQAADRELKEEAGYGARDLRVLRAITLVPGYMNHQSWLVIASDLYAERLVGDEPEEIEVIPWKLSKLHDLMLREDFSEGRSLAALFIVREWLEHQQ